MAQTPLFEFVIQDGGKALKTLTEIRRERDALEKELKKETDPVVIRKLEQELLKVKAEYSKVQKAQSDFIKELKEPVREGSYRDLNKQLVELRKQFKNLTAEERNSGFGKALVSQIQSLDKELKDLDASIGQFQRNVGNYPQTILGALTGAVPGLQNIQEGIGNLGSAATKTGKLIAGAFVAFEVANLIGQGIQQVGALIKEIEALRITASKLNFDNLDEAVVRSRSLADVFGEVDADVLKAANTLTNEFNLSTKEAFDLLENGFLRGADISGEFLDNVREYSTQYNAAKVSAADFLDIIVLQNKLGGFSDKTLDTFKEAVISLREMPKASAEALQGIGISQEQIRQTITEKGIGGAIKLVANQLKNFRDDSQEVGRVLADVFRGAGEDVGLNLVKALADAGDGLDNMQDKLDPLTQRQLDLVKATEDYNKALLELDKSVAGAIGDSDVFVIKLKTLGVQLLNVGANAVTGWKAIFAAFEAFILSFRTRIFQEYNILVTQLQIFGQQVQKYNPFSDATDEQVNKNIQRLQDQLRKQQARRLNPFEIAGKAARGTVQNAKEDADRILKGREAEQDQIEEDLLKEQKRKDRERATERAQAKLKKEKELAAKAAKERAEFEERLLTFTLATRSRELAAVEKSLDQRYKIEQEAKGRLLLLDEQSAEDRLRALRQFERDALQSELEASLQVSSDRLSRTQGVDRLRALRSERGNIAGAYASTQQRLRAQAQGIQTQIDLAGPASNEAEIAARKALRDELAQVNGQIADNDKRFTQDMNALAKDRAETQIAAAEQVLGALSTIVSGIGQVLEENGKRALEGVDADLEKRGEKIAELTRQVEAAEGLQKAALQDRLEKEQKFQEVAEAKKEQLLRKQANRRKAIALAEATVQGALATIRAFAETGPIGAAIAGALAAFQIGIIAAQKFAFGGIVKKHGRITANPHITPDHNGDGVMVLAKPGEGFLNQTHINRGKALYGPDFLKRLGVPGFAGGGVPVPVAPVSTGQLSGSSIASPDDVRFALYNAQAAQAMAQAAMAQVNNMEVNLNVSELNALENEVQRSAKLRNL